MRALLPSLARHALTASGGAAAANGWLSQDDLTALLGALATLLGVVWSILDKRRAARVTTP